MEPLGPDVKRELSRFGAAAGMAELVAAWPGAVGEGIAYNAWPARFIRDGTLVVHTIDAVWAFELTHQAEEIRTRLGTVAPKALKFLAGPLPEGVPEAPEGGPEPVRAATVEEARTAAGWAASVEDPDLRELVARAARASLARAASDRDF
jgi:hypothetical protein